MCRVGGVFHDADSSVSASDGIDVSQGWYSAANDHMGSIDHPQQCLSLCHCAGTTQHSDA